MTNRSLGALMATTAVVALVCANVVGQERAWTQSRTPDGQPDLQGFWTNSTYTPLERPKNVTKEFYTPAEAAEAIKRAAQVESEQTEPGTVADVHYDFSQFGLDRSQSTFSQNLRTSLIVDPPDGKIPPMNAEGRKRTTEREAATKGIGRWDSAESNQLDDRCLIMAGAGPPMMNSAYNSNYQIVQAPGYVMILVEMIHDARIIPLDPFDPSTLREPQGRPEQDRGTTSSGSPRAASRGDKLRVDGERSRTVDGRPLPSQNVRQWMGVSRGRWENNTLVVETGNFNAKNPFRDSSEHMRVTERFTRVDADTILYRFTVEDQATWTRPFTAEMQMRKTVGPLFEHACHEGNYGLYNTLVGARLEEKKK